MRLAPAASSCRRWPAPAPPHVAAQMRTLIHPWRPPAAHVPCQCGTGQLRAPQRSLKHAHVSAATQRENDGKPMMPACRQCCTHIICDPTHPPKVPDAVLTSGRRSREERLCATMTSFSFSSSSTLEFQVQFIPKIKKEFPRHARTLRTEMKRRAFVLWQPEGSKVSPKENKTQAKSDFKSA